MKHIRLLLSVSLVLLAGKFAKAQDTLTNREIYNFEVGDVFHFKTQPYHGAPEYTTVNVIERIEHDLQDSISYKMVDSTYNLIVLYNPPVPHHKLTVREYTITYPFLEEAPAYSFIFTLEEFSSVYDTTLGVVRNSYHFYNGQGHRIHTFYEGIGFVLDVLSYETTNGSATGSKQEPVYYKKGNKEAGTKIPRYPIVSVQNINPTPIKIYPNPAQTELFLQEIPLHSTYSILNVVGAEVAKGVYEGGSIPVSALPQGIYLLHIQTQEQVWQARFVKE